MNKSEFVAAMSRHGAMSKADAGNVLQVFRHTLEIDIPAKKAIKFKPAKELADKVNH